MGFPLLNDDVIKFIREHERADVNALLLKHKIICDLPATFVVDQILARRKAKNKLPSLYNDERIVFPPVLNLEQTSSEETALFKAMLVSKVIKTRDSALDLTGGFGIDSLAFQKIFGRLDFVEPNEQLLELVKENHLHLGVSNVSYHNTTAEEFLKHQRENFNLIYIDPSRRVDNKKVLTLKDSVPDVVGLKEQLLHQSDVLLIKAAPLLDIKLALKELSNVQNVIVLSVKNECKEILFLCRKHFDGEPEITAVNLGADHPDFSFKYSGEASTEIPFVDDVEGFLYEPNASVLKAGAFKTIAQKYSIGKLHPNTHLYTRDKLVEDFPGRVFEILEIVKLEKSTIEKMFPDRSVNVITRNYPLSADELKKKFRITDGGDSYLIAFSAGGKKLVVNARRVK